MKKLVIISIFLFSIIFNIVFVYHLVTVHKDNKNNVLDDVILSTEQQNLINKKTEFIIKKNKELNLELKKCRKDLYSILDNDNPDREKIKICIDAINNIQKEMQINTIEQLLIYKKNLSKSQCDCFMKNVGNEMGIPHKCDENCKCNMK